MLNENVHRKLCFNLNTNKYYFNENMKWKKFEGLCFLIFIFQVIFYSPLSLYMLCHFHSSHDWSLEGLQTLTKSGSLHWILTLCSVRYFMKTNWTLGGQWTEMNSNFSLQEVVWCPQWLPEVLKQEYFCLVLYTCIKLGADGCCQGACI